ncbi:hypothetical protein HDU98_006098, partial [Podochytrium sp. JEL0797]
EDPRNLVGLEGQKAGGRILMRKISSLYQVPKCPRVNGRITPVPSKQDVSVVLATPGHTLDQDPDILSTLDHAAIPTQIAAQAAELPSQQPRTKTIAQTIQKMVLTNAELHELSNDLTDPLSTHQHQQHRRSKMQVRQSFTNTVGTLFPLDYFMDQDEIEVLMTRIEAWKRSKTDGPAIENIQCQGLIQTTSRNNTSVKQSQEIWHNGHLTDYDPTLHHFLIEWSPPYPTRRPITYLHTPDPTPSSRWLSRAEIILASTPDHRRHLDRVSEANVLRAEFESRLVLTQVCGIVAPVVTPGLPGFQDRIVEEMYRQVRFVQDGLVKRKLRDSYM